MTQMHQFSLGACFDAKFAGVLLLLFHNQIFLSDSVHVEISCSVLVFNFIVKCLEVRFQLSMTLVCRTVVILIECVDICVCFTLYLHVSYHSWAANLDYHAPTLVFQTVFEFLHGSRQSFVIFINWYLLNFIQIQ